MRRGRKRSRRILSALLIIFLLTNVLAAIHGYKFTHFAAPGGQRMADEDELSAGEKIVAVAFGVSVPRPVNDKSPLPPFYTHSLDSPRRLEAWYVPADSARGTIIVFHGYGGCRSGMLAKAERLRKAGYNCLLPDFSGAGGSEGRSCSIGYNESEEVRTWFEHVRSDDSGPVYLMGQSMGAVAIMKAMHDKPLPVAGLILECPYGSMLQTVKNRFQSVGLPAFPMAQLMVFWGGTLQGFNAFSLKPETYATSISTPVLLIRGTEDKRVTKEETEAIFRNLAGPRQLLSIGGAGHNDLLEHGSAEWEAGVNAFLNRYHIRP